jgi:hypothetical protein
VAEKNPIPPPARCALLRARQSLGPRQPLGPLGLLAILALLALVASLAILGFDQGFGVARFPLPTDRVPATTPPVAKGPAGARDAVVVPAGRPAEAPPPADPSPPTVPASASIPDPDGVGPCPLAHSPVLRRGFDSSGQPTWWHEDGSMTVRVMQGYTSLTGERSTVPRIVVVRPAAQRADPDAARNDR